MLLSLAKASKELGVCCEHIYRMVRAGKWPAYQLGSKAIRIDVEEIKGMARLVIQDELSKGLRRGE